MADMTVTTHRRPRWQLFLVPGLLLAAAAAWSVFWLFAASQAEVKADAWRAQEARAGRIFDCARRSMAGFPFRLEVRCEGASVSLKAQSAAQDAAHPRRMLGEQRGDQGLFFGIRRHGR